MRRNLFLALFAVLLFASCGSVDEIAYIHDAARDSAMAVTGEFSKGIQANDLLSIYVESGEPSSTIQFNQETNKIVTTSTGAVLNPGSSNNLVSGYLVNADGDILFPVLGKIHVVGLTHNQLQALLEQRLVQEGHIKDAHVTVKLMNFKVCVLGDVTRPGWLNVEGERLTIFEALSMVGDLTIYGQRYNVTIVREENGQRTVGEVDLTSKEIFNSPYYYLHQNDVVYVEPNMRRKKLASRDPALLSYISSGVSLVSTVFTSIYYMANTSRIIEQSRQSNN
ncbi:MAG: polysaccharide biosynthesis/export family protein [Bacteroidales bacterium]|nr:polysaccharide biosynthesis/export family protein [Bacteroidales bacterium]